MQCVENLAKHGKLFYCFFCCTFFPLLFILLLLSSLFQTSKHLTLTELFTVSHRQSSLYSQKTHRKKEPKTSPKTFWCGNSLICSTKLLWVLTWRRKDATENNQKQEKFSSKGTNRVTNVHAMSFFSLQARFTFTPTKPSR